MTIVSQPLDFSDDGAVELRDDLAVNQVQQNSHASFAGRVVLEYPVQTLKRSGTDGHHIAPFQFGVSECFLFQRYCDFVNDLVFNLDWPTPVAENLFHTGRPAGLIVLTQQIELSEDVTRKQRHDALNVSVVA